MAQHAHSGPARVEARQGRLNLSRRNNQYLIGGVYVEKRDAIFRHCSADSEIAIDRADDRFYTPGPNLLLLRGAHHVRTG